MTSRSLTLRRSTATIASAGKRGEMPTANLQNSAVGVEDFLRTWYIFSHYAGSLRWVSLTFYGPIRRPPPSDSTISAIWCLPFSLSTVSLSLLRQPKSDCLTMFISGKIKEHKIQENEISCPQRNCEWTPQKQHNDACPNKASGGVNCKCPVTCNIAAWLIQSLVTPEEYEKYGYRRHSPPHTHTPCPTLCRSFF
jgi:hypothetical protein